MVHHSNIFCLLYPYRHINLLSNRWFKCLPYSQYLWLHSPMVLNWFEFTYVILSFLYSLTNPPSQPILILLLLFWWVLGLPSCSLRVTLSANINGIIVRDRSEDIFHGRTTTKGSSFRWWYEVGHIVLTSHISPWWLHCLETYWRLH